MATCSSSGTTPELTESAASKVPLDASPANKSTTGGATADRSVTWGKLQSTSKRGNANARPASPHPFSPSKGRAGSAGGSGAGSPRGRYYLSATGDLIFSSKARRPPAGTHSRKPPVLGIAHTSKLVSSVGQALARTSLSIIHKTHSMILAPIGNVSLRLAYEDLTEHIDAAVPAISSAMSSLPSGSTVLEVNSRCGDITIRLSDLHPELSFQPTEGTGGTASGLFLLLQERIAAHNRNRVLKSLQGNSQVQRGSQVAPMLTEVQMMSMEDRQILQPQQLDATSAQSWKAALGSAKFNCIFIVDALQYLSRHGLELLLMLCTKALKHEGYIVLCGRFLDGVEASESNLMYSGALEVFNKMPRDPEAPRKPDWVVPDIRHIQRQAHVLGFELVEREKRQVGLHWHLLVLRRSADAFLSISNYNPFITQRRSARRYETLRRLEGTNDEQSSESGSTVGTSSATDQCAASEQLQSVTVSPRRDARRS